MHDDSPSLVNGDASSHTPRPYNPTVPCRAHSSRTGLPCRRAAINGGFVCATHNGRNPAVKRKALERLEKAVPHAVEHLIKAMERGAKIDDLSAVIRAATTILGLCGISPKTQLEVSGPGGGPVELRGQQFRMEDFSIETRRLMLRDMREAAERRAMLSESGETQDTAIEADYEEVGECE